MAVITRWSEQCVVASSDRGHGSASMRGHPRANWDGLAVIARWSELHVVVGVFKDVEVVEII